MRFSGHDTFHCREQWLLKGLQLIDKQGYSDSFKNEESIYQLGVGKNMVRSIQHWLKAFALVDENNSFTSYANDIFSDKKYDPYLENIGTLYILQYYLTSTSYSSVFDLIFRGFFEDKANSEFSEIQIISYLKRLLNEQQVKKFTEKTLKSDFKVFIKTYVAPSKNIKTIEDDFSAPLLPLKLITDTGRKNDLNQAVYSVNKSIRKNLSIYALAYCITDYFDGESSIDFTDLSTTIGSFLALSNEGLEEVIYRLCAEDKRFVFMNDAGVKQLQIKENDLFLKDEMLSLLYSI